MSEAVTLSALTTNNQFLPQHYHKAIGDGLRNYLLHKVKIEKALRAFTDYCRKCIENEKSDRLFVERSLLLTSTKNADYEF